MDLIKQIAALLVCMQQEIPESTKDQLSFMIRNKLLQFPVEDKDQQHYQKEAMILKVYIIQEMLKNLKAHEFEEILEIKQNEENIIKITDSIVDALTRAKKA